jgi:hypothetical protein
MRLSEAEKATISGWVEKIHAKCTEHGLVCGIWLGQPNGWDEEINDFNVNEVDKAGIEWCDLNVEGLVTGGDSRWDNCHEECGDEYWEIEFTWLLDPEFQEQFEQEFQVRHLNYIFS